MAVVGAALQTVWSAGSLTVGVGFTVMVNVCVGPLQIAVFVKTGVTVMVAVTGVMPKLMAANDAMFPLPVAPNPIVVLSFVHV